MEVVVEQCVSRGLSAIPILSGSFRVVGKVADNCAKPLW
jgi:hypothetical protein